MTRSSRTSHLEATLALELRHLGVREPVREYRFAPPRRWRFDFAWPESRLAVEVEGGTYVRGRHQRPGGFSSDCEKYNAATTLGWRVLRYTGEMVSNGSAAKQIAEELRNGG